MAGTASSNLARPTLSLFSSDFRNNPLVKNLFIDSLQRYPNQAIPPVSRPASAASTNCNAATEEDPKHWLEFHNFLLQRMTYKTAQDRLRYAKQYGKVLETGNAPDLLQLHPDKRIHAMKALSYFAKYAGRYDQLLQIRQRHNLKWSTGTEKLGAFERFFDDSKTLDIMLQSLCQARQALPKSYSDFFMFCTLTGPRASECIAALNLIKD
jgi:hypothetical protein